MGAGRMLLQKEFEIDIEDFGELWQDGAVNIESDDGGTDAKVDGLNVVAGHETGSDRMAGFVVDGAFTDAETVDSDNAGLFSFWALFVWVWACVGRRMMTDCWMQDSL